jgi:hypothetical protein
MTHPNTQTQASDVQHAVTVHMHYVSACACCLPGWMSCDTQTCIHNMQACADSAHVLVAGCDVVSCHNDGVLRTPGALCLAPDGCRQHCMQQHQQAQHKVDP